MPIYPNLLESLYHIDGKLKNHIVLEYVSTYIKNEILIENFSNTINSLINKAKKGDIDTDLANELYSKLNKLKSMLSSNTNISAYKIDIVDIMNDFITKYTDTQTINISEDEFSKRYDKLISLLNETSEESNLTLQTKAKNKPFKVYKSKNNAIIFIGGEEKTDMSVSKEKFINIAFHDMLPQYGSYEPIIIEKIIDNTIFNELDVNDLINNFKNSSTEGERLRKLEDDKLKLTGKITELEEKLDSNKELFDSVKNLYENASSLEEDYKNAKDTVLSELRVHASTEFWEDQINFYSKRYIIYLSIAIIASLILVFSILEIDTGFALEAKAEIIKTIEVSNPNVQKDSETLSNSLFNIDLIKYAFMLLLISLTIWIIRIVMKIALSSYHLSIDAKERVTMINTYLALMKEGNTLEENDKKIMIESIFRQTNHGIIKDENSVTVTDIISSFKK
ncbi:MAG: hypothetical protein C0626_08985 [Arcobacter sp.]|uniref:DUF6161 domain-containing protein n=1 Tax=uncultured Arcobacter sp. TaxID=165434 RepID=UPI000CBAD5F2|nr:DUF6161 domain-containing protein [uncultured Arcobacter sp.]PLY09134.1 MAG: hypothetical protein C0626_08985 [Arcobacter sp.]